MFLSCLDDDRVARQRVNIVLGHYYSLHIVHEDTRRLYILWYTLAVSGYSYGDRI